MTILAATDTGLTLVSDIDFPIPYLKTLAPLRVNVPLPVWTMVAALLTTGVFLWMGFSRGLPQHLRVFGKFEDPNPWTYDSDAAAFAEELVTTAGEVDDGTGVEIVRVTGNIIEPGEPGTLLFHRPAGRTWDDVWTELRDSHRELPAPRAIVGSVQKRKSYSLMHKLRETLKAGRVVVLELRETETVYLFERSGSKPLLRCRAWRVALEDWRHGGCAVLKDPKSCVFLVDVDQLPQHLRVFGKFEDPNPWTYDSDAAAFAEELVSTAGEVDDGTGVEIVRVTGNIIEPGEPGTLLFHRPAGRTWDDVWTELRDSHRELPAPRAIVGSVQKRKSYSLMHKLRETLKAGRVVVLELRETETVYLFERSGSKPLLRCRAWRVALEDWRHGGCAVLKDPKSCVFLVDVDQLPQHLRVFGKFEDPNPWTYDSDAAAFAEELVTTAGEVDDGTGVEIVRVTGNIIEPGEPGTLLFHRPAGRTWDDVWTELRDSHRELPAPRAIVGSVQKRKSYSLMHKLRETLKAGRVVVLELRETETVYLFERSGSKPLLRCRAWRVALEDWRHGGCAVLKDPKSCVFLVDVDQLPQHLRVFGKFEDPNPWTYDSDAAAFAEELVTTAGEVDDGTGVEIVRVTGNIIEPGEPGALFFRRGVINIWDRFYDQLCVQRHKRRAAMLGNAGTGKSYSLMYLLRRALMDNRVVVVELRKTEVVYLFEPSGVPPPSEQDDDRAWSKFKCRAWVVTLRDWRDANCAALCVQDNVYLIDPNEAGKPPLHRPRAARAFVAASLNPDHVKEWLKDGGVSRAVGVATLAEMQVVGRTLRQWSPEKVLRRFLVCGGRIRALLADDTPTRMATLVTTLAHETLWNITLYGQVNPGLDGKYEASSALVATVPEPNGIETKLAAVSPYALQLLTMYHRDLILKHTGTAPTPGAAGRIYEQYFQLSFALGGNFRVRQLVADDDNTITAEQVVTLPRSLIVPLRTGPTQAAGFVEQWAQLPTTAQLDTAANPGAVPLGRAADPKQHFLQSIGQLPQADRRAALPNFDIDLAAVVDIATATADDASDDGDDRDGGDDDGDGATHCLLVPDVPLDNVPIVDAADARDRAFQVTRTPLHRRKKMGLRQLEQYLNATGATTARPLKLYYFVTTEYFIAAGKDPVRRIGITSSDGARVAALRSRFQEFMMCPVASTNAPFKQSATELWDYEDAS